MEDDCLCEYDSTWDTESDGDDPAGESQTRRSSQDKNKSSWALWHSTPRNMRAAKDMQNYRRGYPNLTDDECSEDKMNNLKFYLNQFPSAPDDIHIDFFHKEWKNDYKRLERVHSYIQWLFPLREPGVNYMASELTKKEIEAFKKNDEAKRRLVESYELMLGFYGIQLVNRETGEVRRAENWKERFVNLERNMHNNLRITRILKSVGELGFKHFQAPLVQFFLEETLVKKNLSSVKRSVLDYFLFAVLDKKQRQNLVRFAYLHFEPKDKFVWCPRKIQKQFKKTEKKPEVVGDEVSSQATRKDGEAVDPQQENNVAEAKKGTHKDILSEGSPELKREAVKSTEHSDNTCVENGNGYDVDNEEDCTDKTSQMDHSPSPDTVPVNAETSKHEDSVHEPMCNMQTEGELESKKQIRKDSNALPSNGSAASPDGQMEEKDASNNPSILVSTPLKTRPECSSKHAPSLFLEREGKIPRTEFSDKTVGMEEESMSQERVLETLAGTDRCLDRQSNGKDSENMEVELSPPSSEGKSGRFLNIELNEGSN